MKKKAKPRIKATKLDRLIYSYWDGSRHRRADPQEIQDGLTTIDGFDLAIDLKLAVGESKEALPALRRVVQAVRQAFHVGPYNEGPPETGLTAGECMTLLTDFGAYCEELKKKLGPYPTSANATEQLPSDDPSPQRSDTDSPSTKPESSPEEP